MKKLYIVLIGLAVILLGVGVVWKWVLAPQKAAENDLEVREQVVSPKKDQNFSSDLQEKDQTGSGSAKNKTDSESPEAESTRQRKQADSESGKSGEVSEPEDEVITRGFVRDLARLVFDHYVPGTQNGTDAEFTLTFREVNSRYGLNMYGLQAEGSSVVDMRNFLFKYLFRKKVLQFLADEYTPIFVRELVSVARSTPKTVPGPNGEKTKVVLEDSQISDMFVRLSTRVKEVSRILAGCAEKENIELLHSYIQAEEEVRNAYHSYWQKDKEGNQTQELGGKIKEAISGREQARKKLHRALGNSEGSVQAVYIAKWAFRRLDSGVCGPDCLKTLSTLGSEVALKLERSASEL
ncbi:MAG: hypothetical protein ACLFMP_06155 [Desulfonatronovibrionaceae bacterium]